MRLPRFLSKITPGFEVIELKEWISKGFIEIYLKRESKERKCCRCNHLLSAVKIGEHRVRIRSLDIMKFKTYLVIKRQKHYCPNCKKVRSEQLDFVSNESPTMTKEYAWWLGKMFEFSPVSRVAKFTDNNQMSLWRLDFERMKRMFQYYKIPPIKRICVDEVYARSKKYHAKECRDNQFFTIITDLETSRVLWVSESRDKAALDEFFHVIGEQRCKEIEVVAMDQHNPYRASVQENCPNAEVVWDKFHIMQSFEMALNEERKDIHSSLDNKSKLNNLASGRYKYLFLKKEKDRTKQEQRHFERVARENTKFYAMDLIKERILHIFYERDELDALWILNEVEDWINFNRFKNLKSWFKHFMNNWETIKNYYKYRVTSATAEGINNVIKTTKKRAYGYRNMAYFKLKILQVCGYLNSKYIPMEF